MAKSHLKLVAPTEVNRTTPTRRPNAELRTREHLTPSETAARSKARRVRALVGALVLLLALGGVGWWKQGWLLEQYH